MKSVAKKIETLRRAVAQSRVQASPETLKRLLSNDVPKKDILPIARAAGVMAAKKTPELLPYCHPIAIDWVEIEFEVQDNFILIYFSIVQKILEIGADGVIVGSVIARIYENNLINPYQSLLKISQFINSLKEVTI